ncbi:hypothetical protein VNO77_05032 [Canavalia gladiata]|uniref:Uncharacterized protein n=1 Tax=Canavalia gladiata TaxID=3824 RepID=A0AAN9MY72_CANGL
MPLSSLKTKGEHLSVGSTKTENGSCQGQLLYMGHGWFRFILARGLSPWSSPLDWRGKPFSGSWAFELSNIEGLHMWASRVCVSAYNRQWVEPMTHTLGPQDRWTILWACRQRHAHGCGVF